MTKKVILSIVALCFTSVLQGQEARDHRVVPFKATPQSSGGFEVVSGDPDKARLPYVIRISNDAGYVVLPHTHPEDENIVVVQGSWTVAMGNRVNRPSLQPMELGAYVLVPKKAPHFGWSKTPTGIVSP